MPVGLLNHIPENARNLPMQTDAENAVKQNILVHQYSVFSIDIYCAACLLKSEQLVEKLPAGLLHISGKINPGTISRRQQDTGCADAVCAVVSRTAEHSDRRLPVRIMRHDILRHLAAGRLHQRQGGHPQHVHGVTVRRLRGGACDNVIILCTHAAESSSNSMLPDTRAPSTVPRSEAPVTDIVERCRI